MLELAHKLADCDAKFFGGWIIAGMEVHLHGEAAVLTNRTLLAKERKCIMQVLGCASDGSTVKELRTFLVLPKEGSGAKAPAAAEPAGELLAGHVFTAEEVHEYVAFTGDKNVIHEGEHPIVPGLCMAAWLQQSMGLATLDWRISFLAPVYAGDQLAVYREENLLSAYVGSFKVFTIKY